MVPLPRSEKWSEQWADVPQFPGYQVSDRGTVLGKSGKPLKPEITRRGYRRVKLQKDGRPHNLMVHRVVLAAFHGECPPGKEGRHHNGDPADNRLVNLSWSTHIENLSDVRIHGTNVNSQKTRCPKGHPYSPENTRMYRGRRHCRQCARDRHKRR